MTCTPLTTQAQQIIAQLPGALLPWYAQNARILPWRTDKSPYHVWLSEIMLQQTRVEAVRGYYTRFLESFPTMEALASAPEDQLFKLWEGLGYYNRARNLQKAAKQIVEHHDGEFPAEYDAIAALPGIGPYTAGAVASICFEQPTPAVDGNVLRVIARTTKLFDPIDAPKVKQAITEALKQVYPAGNCGAFTQSLMELGATICLPNGKPKCEACPVNGICLARLHHCTRELPVKTPKRARRTEQKTIFLFSCNGRLAIRRRADQGLLAGLWEFPNTAQDMTEEQALQQAAAWGVKPLELIRQTQKQHIFTHITWVMRCYVMRCAQMPADFYWATRAQLLDTYALPTAFRMFLPAPDEWAL